MMMHEAEVDARALFAKAFELLFNDVRNEELGYDDILMIAEQELQKVYGEFISGVTE